MSSPRPKFDPSKVSNLLSRGAAESARTSPWGALSAVPPSPASPPSAALAEGDSAPEAAPVTQPEQIPDSLAAHPAPAAAAVVAAPSSAANEVAVPEAPPLPPMRKLSFHLTEETVYALYAYQSKVRVEGAKPSDTTLGWVTDTLLRQALNMKPL